MYKKIMVPLDGSELAEAVLPHVEAFIKEFKINEVVLARVLESNTNNVRIPSEAEIYKAKERMQEEYEEQNKTSEKDYLNKISERLKNEGTSIHSEILTGKVAESLADYAVSNDVNLIVIATRGRSGITRWIMGSVTDKLLRSAKMPVLMVPAGGNKNK